MEPKELIARRVALELRDRREPRLLQDGLNRHRAQNMRGQASQGSVETADRRTRGSRDDDLIHATHLPIIGERNLRKFLRSSATSHVLVSPIVKVPRTRNFSEQMRIRSQQLEAPRSAFPERRR